MISFKGRHHKQELMLQCVRWYVAYSLSYRDLEELMQERGYVVDHSTIQRWVVHYAPRIEKVFRKNKKRTGLRWRVDESYLKINGQWNYLYRAVDKEGNTIDFLLTAKRDTKRDLVVRRFGGLIEHDSLSALDHWLVEQLNHVHKTNLNFAY